MNTRNCARSLRPVTPPVALAPRSLWIGVASILILLARTAAAQTAAPTVFLPPVPDPPSLPVRPPHPVVVPNGGNFDAAQLLRCRPLGMRAVATDGSEIPPQVIRRAEVAHLRLPGLAADGNSAQIWSSFWLELRFHPSKTGTTVTVSCVEGNAQFVGDNGGSSSFTAVIGAGGLLRGERGHTVTDDIRRDGWRAWHCAIGIKTAEWPQAEAQP